MSQLKLNKNNVYKPISRPESSTASRSGSRTNNRKNLNSMEKSKSISKLVDRTQFIDHFYNESSKKFIEEFM